MTHTIEEQARVGPTQRQEGTGKLLERLKLTFRALRRLRAELCILAATLGFANLVLRWLYSDFVRGSFHFHDLTLITDFFTNALRHARPFWITDCQINHFRLHFTPNLVLLIPAFALFRSQFALIAIVAATIFAAIAIATREQLESMKQAGVPAYSRIVLAASFFVLRAFKGQDARQRMELRAFDSRIRHGREIFEDGCRRHILVRDTRFSLGHGGGEDHATTPRTNPFCDQFLTDRNDPTFDAIALSSAFLRQQRLNP